MRPLAKEGEHRPGPVPVLPARVQPSLAPQAQAPQVQPPERELREEEVAVPVAEPGPPSPKASPLAKSTRILPVSSFLVFPRFSTQARLARAGVGPRRHETRQPATLSIILWPPAEKSARADFLRHFLRTRAPLPQNP